MYSCCSLIYMFMQDTYIYWIRTDAMITDAMIKMQENFFNKIFTSHFIARVRNGCVGFYCERDLEIEHNCNILTPQTYGRQRCVFLVLQGCSTRGPGPTLLSDGFLYCILSASSLDPNSSGPQASSAWCGFPYHISSGTVWDSTRSSNSTELYNRSAPTRSLKSNV